jgi:GR25 family glycosyltransferase involved in LPS biosynthesis
LVCSLIWLFGFSYGRLFLWRDPHSAYFRSESVYDLDYSAVRQNQSREFIAQVTRDAAENLDNGAGEGRMSKAGDTPALCAMFVTVRRESETARLYLADAVGSMLAGLDPRERTALNLSLLFADTDPTRHPDWDAPWVKALVDDASGYKGLTDLQSAGLRKAEEERDLQLKGVFDYVYVLERCLEETGAPFIAVLEDDIVFSADWMARTLRGLQYIVRDRQPSEAENGTDWLYLRLFYTETHLGWVADEDWWYGHLPLTLGLSAACTATALLVLRSLGCGSRLRLDLATIAVVSVLVAPSFTVLAFMAGKHNLPLPGSLHSRGPLAASTSSAGVVPMDKHGCCTQALVFNRLALPGLIQALRQKERGQTDMMIEEYADAIGIKRFAMGDQVAQHVGLVSSRGMSAENTRSVWAFWFEAYKPHEVERRHQKALEEVDWSMFAKLAGAGI